ncbi:MAG: hypothetical protein JJU28_20210 [Cyclobacteriaceae bacterium]|nr:hypothetical protein [Cyclobacteriaceae bacterium]
MKLFPLLVLIFHFSQNIIPEGTQKAGARYIEHENHQILTTFKVPEKFYGSYIGSKTGFLTLKKDGTGTYRYDYAVPGPQGCVAVEVSFTWGFILDDKGKVLRFERDYGFSYPIIYHANDQFGFRGCTKSSMVDYIQDRNNGTLHVSSSDDWHK